MESLKKNAQKRRRKQGKGKGGKKKKLKLCEIELTDGEIFLPDGETRFVALDSGKDDPKRTIIFATKDNTDRLSRCTKVFSDGTFKRPKHFAQVSLSLESVLNVNFRLI